MTDGYENGKWNRKQQKNGQETIQIRHKGETCYLVFPSFEETGVVRHLFSTRMGGVSTGKYAAMNLSFTRGDEDSAVMENFRRIADVLDCRVEDMVFADQTHTTNIRCVTREDMGKGIVRKRDYADVDGLITKEPGVVLVTFFADCVPLFFCDPKKRVIGLAHSGWRGSVGRIGAHMADTMEQKFGCDKSDILTAIGPSICQDCYEVSEDVAQIFREEFGEAVLKPGRVKGKYQLDLWRANEMVLRQAGISRIEVTDICTCCNGDYLFSHRASKGERGSLAAFLTLCREG